MADDVKHFTMRMPSMTHRRLAHIALRDEQSMGAIVLQLIERHIDGWRDPATAEPLPAYIGRAAQ